MKLYTKEQVIKAICEARKMKSWWDLEFEFDGEDIVKQLTPIELPSDDEIEKAPNNTFSDFFYHGAKWMKEQLLNQNK